MKLKGAHKHMTRSNFFLNDLFYFLCLTNSHELEHEIHPVSCKWEMEFNKKRKNVLVSSDFFVYQFLIGEK